MRWGVRLKAVLAVLIGTILQVAPATASAATYTVIGTSDSTAPCAGTACPSLRAAVLAADGDPGSTIKLGAAAYSLGGGTGVTVGTGELRLTADMTIAGAGSGATSIVQTDGAHRVINISAGTVTLSGLRVTGGKLTGSAGSHGGSGGAGGDIAGGGIDNAGDLSLVGVVVSGNSATGGAGGSAGPYPNPGNGGSGGSAFGAGIASAGSLSMVASAVSGNVATGGAGGSGVSGAGGAGGNATGGIYISPLSPGQTTIRGSAISSNAGTGGAGGQEVGTPGHTGGGGDATGGLSQGSQTLTLVDSTLGANTADGGTGGGGFLGVDGGLGGDEVGAGVALLGGSLQIERSTVSSNRGRGGDGGTATGANGGSGGSAFGGGLYLQSNASLVNATVTGNGAAAGLGGVPSGGSPGGNGDGVGGGLYDGGGPPQAVTLASDTLATNAAATGGNLWDGTTQLAVSDTIISDGTATTGSNCVTGALTDNGHNLDSTSPTQCRLSAGADDLIGVDPQLGALAVHGGSAATLSLGPFSPARGAGGQCLDPTTGGQPLSVDQRGLPRPVPCDMGAFQSEPPASTSLPQVTGRTTVGGTLACGGGAWTGDGPLSFGYQWLRDGAPIAGATGTGYRVAGVDVRHRLSCRVTATGVYGQRSAVSGPVTISPLRFGGSTLLATRLKLDGHGNVIIRVACSSAAPGGSCRDVAALYTTRGKLPATISRHARGATSLGKARFSLRAGRRGSERIHLGARGRGLFRAITAVRLRLILASRDAFADVQTRVYGVIVGR